MNMNPAGSDPNASPDLSVVIPLYNSAEILPLLLDRLELALSRITRRYEIIVVNDGSRDDTWSQVQTEIKRRANLVALNMMRNYGQHNALLAGIRLARYPLCVTMDDDLQNPPEEISQLLAALTSETDVVYGAPLRERHNLARNLASRVTKLVLSRSMNAGVAEQVSAFRLFRTELRQAFAAYRGPFVNIDVLLTWGTTRFVATKVTHDRRAAGVSNYTFGRLVTHAVNMITGFSVLPLQTTSLLGVAMAMFGGLVLVYVLGRYLVQGSPVPGFPFLASVIAIFSGAQLLSLGIIGEYLWRMYFRVMDRPPYIVRTQLHSEEQDGSASDL
jgi:glycosyltransferase involved in cell wall biosynthesis